MRRTLPIALLVALCLSLIFSATALAHAELVSSTPAAGARLTSAPTKITLVFSEEISEVATDSFFTVSNAAGAEVGRGTLDNTDLDHKTLSGTPTSSLADGVYTVNWQTVTPDDNGKSEGSFTFGVNADPGAQPTAEHEHEEEAAPTAAAGSAAQPTARPTAAAGTAQPTASAGGQPGTLPNTGDGDAGAVWLLIGAAIAVLAAGIVARRGALRGR
jgi:LPXTG-motif cell wall-anchored protein